MTELVYQGILYPSLALLADAVVGSWIQAEGINSDDSITLAFAALTDEELVDDMRGDGWGHPLVDRYQAIEATERARETHAQRLGRRPATRSSMGGNVEIYTFEDEYGNEASSFVTQNYSQARQFAEKYECRLVAHVYQWSHAETLKDYTDGKWKEAMADAAGDAAIEDRKIKEGEEHE